MRQPLTLSLALIACACISGVAMAQAPAAPAATAKADPRVAIAKRFGDIKLEDVRMSPVSGVYEVTRGSEISYVTADGRYAILGDMIDIDADANLSENRRRTIRARIIETIPDSEMVVYSPRDPKYTITVFTDIDCGYCRRLHSQIAEYNRLGIRVRYMFFPRSGPNTDSWHKAEAVWCSSNRNEALTRAKNGEDVKSPKCPSDIVKRDFELGQKLAVDGTPAIFLQSGEMLPGYAPPGQLARYLKTGKM
ncbi:MAG: thiol:disulfide interchange protein DsbC [Steroidobacteraceae bacterium]|jgi:thiol:disulfide interchange protein DsbC|nr:thiol:disulfide interchange protein DsbC [Steroidobacteraceae bacterium]